MSRIVSVCLCAAVTFAALTGTQLLAPTPALAADGVVSMETPLHDAPDHGAPLIALLPEGSIVTIEGPPVDGFYPVMVDGLSGWMRGETLLLEKDVVPEEVASPAAEESGELLPVPVEQTSKDIPPVETTVVADPSLDPNAPVEPATDPAAPVEPAPVAATTPDPTLVDPAATDPAMADPATKDPAMTEPSLVDPAAQDPALSDPAAAPTDPAAPAAAPAPETLVPAPVQAEATETAPVSDPMAVTPTPAALVTEPPPADPAEAPPADPVVTPLPAPDPGPTGPASVTSDMPIRSGPGPAYGLIFTVPLGSTVEQTGHLVDGYVTVQFKEVTGWAPADQLGPPNTFVPETPPAETAAPIETKAPKAGSGVAYATIDLSMRAGPSAESEPLAPIPAGSRVVLTGVMEGGFQRVEFHDELGWVADEYLQTPPDPNSGGGGNGSQQNYSRREIVRIIYDAADRYDQSRDDMLRVAECESNLDPFAVNPSGSYGLFQFIRSTWRSTPYGNKDVFDPKANANAAGWMWSQGRKSEWVCQ